MAPARQYGIGVMTVSNVNPVEGSSATALPVSPPNPASCEICADPDRPASAGSAAVLSTFTPFGGTEIPTLGPATVDEANRVIQVDRVLTINKTTVGDLVKQGL